MKLPEMELLTKQKQRVLLHSLFLLKSGNYLLIRRMDNGELGQRKRRHRRLLISDGITRQIKACSEKSRPRPYGAPRKRNTDITKIESTNVLSIFVEIRQLPILAGHHTQLLSA